MKKYVKTENGITLVALVITIIVLLILAGIAIVALSGENGILVRASEAKKKTEREEIIEKAKLEILEYQAENEGKITNEQASKIIAKHDINYKENEEFHFEKNEQMEEIIKVQGEMEIPIREIYQFPQMIKCYIDGVTVEVPEGTTWLELDTELLSGDASTIINEARLSLENNPGKEISLYAVVTSASLEICIHDENNIIPNLSNALVDGATYTISEYDENIYG